MCSKDLLTIQKYTNYRIIANDYDFFLKYFFILLDISPFISYLCNCKLDLAILMNQKISHSGVIEHISDGCIHVRIVQTSACAACKVAGYCHAAESKEKTVDVYCDSVDGYQVGQPVVVTASAGVAARALLWGFGVPFLVLLGVLLLVLLLTGREGLAALSALAALIPYYFILWLLRDKMRKQLAFAIEL
jgi:sigma-E factor negative regulatory protein RseC